MSYKYPQESDSYNPYTSSSRSSPHLNDGIHHTSIYGKITKFIQGFEVIYSMYKQEVMCNFDNWMNLFDGAIQEVNSVENKIYGDQWIKNTTQQLTHFKCKLMIEKIIELTDSGQLRLC
jgi:hypothetical protein